MNYYNTSERNIQIVLRLLKENGINKVIVSPGATDVSIVASMQHDPYFKLYSCIDERSAAYMACGMAAELKEPVVITCTGATSSRNYMPGLTEAYYRHLPILAITCCRSNVNVGHYVDQVTDRSVLPNDIANVSVYAQTIHCPDDEWDVMIKVNKAILGLTQNGGGPCHINLATIYSKDFSVKELPSVRLIHRYTLKSNLPSIPPKKIGIFVGAHMEWSCRLTELVDKFCGIYDAAVFCDQTSNYRGKYRVLFPLITEQYEDSFSKQPEIDLLIHIGFVSNCVIKGKEIWRVNEDGVIRDPFRKMVNVFQMSEEDFFEAYTKGKEGKKEEYLLSWQKRYGELLLNIPDLPFSNLWVAQHLASEIPDNSVMHFGIRNSIRSWNYFETPESVRCYCNTGGFGIDGGVSSLIGASFCHPEKLYFGFFGDLLFYYDMNCLGNRDISPNVRILIVNNGLGQEFKNYGCYSSMFGEETDSFIAAKGHYSRGTIKGYAESLGFEYISCDNKIDFESLIKKFTESQVSEHPILFEVFTESMDESEAYKAITTISVKSQLMLTANDIIQRPELKAAKNLLKKFIHK